MKKELVVKYGQFNLEDSNNRISLQFEQFISFFTSREILKHCFHYSSVCFLCKEFEYISRPFLVMVMCRLMTSGKCVWYNQRNEELKIDLRFLIRHFWVFVKENLTYRKDLLRHIQELEDISQINSNKQFDESKRYTLYLKENLAAGLISGGSISHAIGVINNLEKTTKNKTVVITIEQLPNVNKDVILYNVRGQVKFCNVKDYMSIAVNDIFYDSIKRMMKDKDCNFIYQRCSLNAFAGVRYAQERGIPFVLEYNSSEVWTSKQWGGNTLKFLRFSEKVENLLLQEADLITCVSKPLKQELSERGIEEEKIIVTPNGVDVEKYNPKISGRRVREKYGIKEEKIVIGFIGTFGKWHGVEVLTEAFADVVEIKKYKEKVHLMLIGDGVRMPMVKSIIHDRNIRDYCTLTGSVPQEQGPEYLAACDILVSPTLKNPDGTSFFGSPTKLFEYMAMGKAIIASDMDQMAEILKNNLTALLVEPNNPKVISDAIVKLVKDEQLRIALGKSAFRDVSEKYTWEIHTNRIYQSLKERFERE